MDFTFNKYKNLIQEFLDNNYEILKVNDVINNNIEKFVILRHDVDRYPKNALKMAKIENSFKIKSTYYFRIVSQVYKEEIIKQIQNLGHEVSYHYEDLTLMKGNYEKAIKHFKYHLNRFRKYAEVKTICRHGSPLSKWDNIKLWVKYNYRDLGISLDTENDINFEEVFYISDNGMGWNKKNTSVRDKVSTHFNIPIKGSDHLMKLIKNNELPEKIMLNAHPDTFFDFGLRWVLNFFFIKGKNIIKWFIVKFKIIK